MSSQSLEKQISDVVRLFHNTRRKKAKAAPKINEGTASLSICLEVDFFELGCVCVRGIKANEPLIDIIYRPYNYNAQNYFGREDCSWF